MANVNTNIYTKKSTAILVVGLLECIHWNLFVEISFIVVYFKGSSNVERNLFKLYLFLRNYLKCRTANLSSSSTLVGYSVRWSIVSQIHCRVKYTHFLLDWISALNVTTTRWISDQKGLSKHGGIEKCDVTEDSAIDDGSE